VVKNSKIGYNITLTRISSSGKIRHMLMVMFEYAQLTKAISGWHS